MSTEPCCRATHTLRYSHSARLSPSKRPVIPHHRPMSLRCLFKVHRPMLTSIVRRADRSIAFCDDCGSSIERSGQSRWARSEPLVSSSGQVAMADRSELNWTERRASNPKVGGMSPSEGATKLAVRAISLRLFSSYRFKPCST